MACKVYINGAESNLFNTILEAYDGNEESATALHFYFSSPEFIKNFGNWQEDYNNGYETAQVDYNYNKDISRVDDNGEPMLFKDNKGDYYFIDKDKNKEYVIFNNKSLNSLFNYSEIKLLTEVLANNFTRNHTNLDFENISLGEINISLRQSIVDKLNERIDSFRESEDYLWEDKADLLEEALNNNLDEIVNNVRTYFQQSKLSYKEYLNENLEDTDLENIEIAENEKDPGFGMTSFERSTKDNISANVKLRLSLLEDITQKDYFLNDVVYVKFDEVYVTLLNNLNSKVALDINNSQEDLFDIYKEEIAKLSNKKPYFKELYRLLSKPDLSDNIKSEFVQAFNLDKNGFNTSVTSNELVKENLGLFLDENNVYRPNVKEYQDISHDVLNIANVGSKEVDIFNQWNNNFKTSFTTLDDNNKTIISNENRDKLRNIKSDINKVRQSRDINSLVKSLRDLGIETTQQGFQHYLDNLELINQNNELSQELLNKTITNTTYFIDNILNNKNLNYNSALTDQSIFRDIARAESFYVSEGSDSSVYTAGKQKWVYSYPSYLSTKIKSWKKDRSLLLDHYNISKYNQGSDWMKYLLALGDTYQVNEFVDTEQQESERINESKRRINELEISTFNVIQEDENAAEGLDNKSVDKASYISDTVNKILAFNKNAKSFYRTTTPADKGTQYEIYTGRNHSTNARYVNDDVVINSSASEVIFEYFNAEYKRMKYEREFMLDPSNESKLSVYYHLGSAHAFKSQLFPSLSFDRLESEMSKLPIEDRFTSIYMRNEQGQLTNETSYSDLSNPLIKDKILKYINNELSNNIKSTLDLLTQNGVFELVNGEYVNKSLDTKVWDSYQVNPALKASADFYINSIISHVEYSKMFAGDIAYYKNGVDYKKRVPATYTDGLQLRLNDINNSYNIAVTESIEIATPFLPELTELVGKDIADNYKKINSADAQAWITPQRWKAIFQSLGKWNDIYESSYQKLIGNNTEPFTVEELKKVAPPVKGVYFQVVNGKPIFLKYSQAVLSPRLRQGNGLEKIYNQMIDQSIDELLTFDAIKVGSNKPTKLHDDNGNVLDNVSFNIMNIPSNGWKLQQDLPVKTFKETEVGSQIQKNIFQGLSFNLEEQFTLDGKEYIGNEIVQQIAEVVGDLSNRGYNRTLREFGIGEDGIITNIEGFYKTIANELRERGGSTNVIQALESETSIYGIPQAQSKLQNIFASIVNSRILKIKTNGGSFIQMSNFGLNKENAEAQGVIWSPRALSTTHEPQYLKTNNSFKVTEFKGFWKREDIQKDNDNVYLFGDNTDDRVNTKYIPSSTQAVIRGLSNAIGIDTKKNRGTSNESFLTDNDFDNFKQHVDEQINKAKNSGKNIIIPADGIGTGKAMLKEKAPKLFQYLQNELKILKENKGEFVLSENGKKIVRPGGILLSGAFIAKYIPDYRKYSSEQLFNEIIDRKIQENIIGYRIPNQGLSSNDALEIVGILPEENGDTVVAYTGITTKTGSDFDIDKMYMMFPSYKLDDAKLVYESYNEDISIDEQSIGAVQNRLIELYKSVLINENVIKDVMTPIDFDHMKQDIRSIFKQTPISNLSLYDPLADIDTKYSFLAGKAGVGQEANALIDYVLGSLADLGITNFDIIKGNERLDAEYSQPLDDKDLSYYQKELALSNDQVKGLKKIKISHSLSAILNAFVDIAKDPYITEGNWVSMTTNTGNLLLRKGVHPFYVNAFLAQPIIKKYIDFTEQYEQSPNQSLSTRDEFRKEYVKEQLVGELLSIQGKNIDLNQLYEQLFTSDDINPKKSKDIKKGINSFTAANILNVLKISPNVAISSSEMNSLNNIHKLLTDTHSKIFFPGLYNIIENNSLETIRKNISNPNVEFQAKVFNDFLQYQNASKAIKTNIDASKFMVNGIGKNVTSLNISKNLVDSILYKEEKYDELIDKDDFRGNIITGFKSKFTNPNGSLSMFYNYYNNIILGVQEIVKNNPKLFLSANTTVQNTFDEISYSIYDDILIDDTLGTMLERDFYSYTMSGFQPFQITIEERRDLISNFPKEFKAFKESNKGLYPIVDQLIIKPGEGKTEFISLSNRKKSAEFEESLVNSWNDLLTDEPDIAENLIKYSFFTSGFAININQFYTYIPSQWFIRNKINRFIIDQSNEYSNQSGNIDNFTDQFFMSNIENRSLVKVARPYKIDNKNSLTVINKGFVNKTAGKSDYYTARIVEDGIINYKLIGYNAEMKGIYSRFIPNINNELIDIRQLNIKDNRGNKIVNYNTEGLILKPSNGLSNLIDTDYYNQLNEAVIYPRDYFFKQNYVDNKFDDNTINNELDVDIDITNNNLTEEDSPCKGGIDI